MRAALVALAVTSALTAVGCRPKGSDKTPVVEKTATDGLVLRHPNFEAHLEPKIVRDAGKLTLHLDASYFPDKSAIVLPGNAKPLPIARTGADIPTLLDLTATLADAPEAVVTDAHPVPIALAFELTFFDGRQKVAASIPSIRPMRALRACFEDVARDNACSFGAESPGNTVPNIVYFSKGDQYPRKLVGTAARVRDVDWIALGEPLPDVAGTTCKMEKVDTNNPFAGTGLTSEMVLQREAERITVYDRRTAKKLHDQDFVAADVCPRFQDVKATGAKAGLRSALAPHAREDWFKSLRGEQPPPSSQPASKSKPRRKP